MLFISRFIGDGKYGIVDSDDNVEQSATFGDLLRCANLGLEVGGMTIKRGTTSSGIAGVEVWRGLRLKDVNATKLLTLRGIDIRVWNGRIGGIYWDTELLNAPVTIRLSDFGTVCCDRMIYYARASAENLKNDITLVLDDKLVTYVLAFQLSFNTFAALGGSGKLIIDLREVTKTSTVEDVYRGLAEYITVLQSENRLVVLDKPDRYQRWRNRLARD